MKLRHKMTVINKEDVGGNVAKPIPIRDVIPNSSLQADSTVLEPKFDSRVQESSFQAEGLQEVLPTKEELEKINQEANKVAYIQESRVEKLRQRSEVLNKLTRR